MAPIKVKSTPQHASASGASSAAIRRPKRGQRGFRKFRNGLLNVTPKGKEIAIGKKNAQRSSLLRLPAEIRNMIWKYVLSGKVRVAHINAIPPSRYPFDCFNLLRVCRQIYHETATLPYTTSTFLSDHVLHINSHLKSCKRTTKRKQLQYIQSLVLAHCGLPAGHEDHVRTQFQLLSKLPALHKVCIVVWTAGALDMEPVVRAALEGKEVTFQYVDNFAQWLEMSKEW